MSHLSHLVSVSAGGWVNTPNFYCNQPYHFGGSKVLCGWFFFYYFIFFSYHHFSGDNERIKEEKDADHWWTRRILFLIVTSIFVTSDVYPVFHQTERYFLWHYVVIFVFVPSGWFLLLVFNPGWGSQNWVF